MHLKFLPTARARPARRSTISSASGTPRGTGARASKSSAGIRTMVAAVADSLEFERRYTPAVIAWAPEDRPTDEQIEAVRDEFEKTAWAGLEPDRYGHLGAGITVHGDDRVRQYATADGGSVRRERTCGSGCGVFVGIQ